MTQQYAETITKQASQARLIAKPLQLVAAFALGGAIVYGAGFVNTAAVHNAAHDTRHSQGFPCH
jgi:cobalt transporter subunit CbtB